MSQMKSEFSVLMGEEARLDVFLSGKLENISRSQIKNLITSGNVLINGAAEKAGAKLKCGDIVEITVPEARPAEAQPEDIPLEIVFEDADIVIVNKPQGMVVHPAPGNPDGTLVNALLHHIKDLSGIGGELRPGIVHRLDKDTSGLMMAAKNDAAHTALAKMLAERKIGKTYTALVYGNIKEDDGEIITLIDRDKKDRKKMAVANTGREAVSKYRIIERFGDYTLLEIDILTGRTHQIRVHLKHIGHPVVGDTVYSKHKSPFKTNGQLLHASRLVFLHPSTGEEMEFCAPLPGYFSNVLAILQRKGSAGE